MKWYLKCLKQYADSSGRASRKEYWMFFLFNLIFVFVTSIIDAVLEEVLLLEEEDSIGVITLLYLFVIFIPHLAVTVRRLHDINISGWWILIGLVPLIGYFWLLILLVTNGNPYENRYGKDPKEFQRLKRKKKYDNVDDFSEGLALVELNGKYGYIDDTGTEVIPLKYDGAWDFSEGMSLVLLKGKYGYIDKTGKEVIPLKYDDAVDFSEGLAIVLLKGKYGYIDKTEKEVIPLQYDNAWKFSGGLAKVELDGNKFYIDKTGKYVKK
jgi:uncharacterized membrane protein YhaH (DUF805 family)